LKTLSAKDAKNSFGMLIDTARAEPVIVEKHGRAVVVVLSIEEYERLLAATRLTQAKGKRVVNLKGYHVAAHISLHKLFRLRRRPVPAFLMFDQPSQAHYPPERDENGRVDGLTDEDQAAVQRLFKLLSVFSAQSHSQMQIIVADHVELLEQ
jgi:prevent-host-death family protein